MRFILHRPLPLVCVGSFRLCGTAGSRGGSGARGHGGWGPGGVGGWEPGTREHVYLFCVGGGWVECGVGGLGG